MTDYVPLTWRDGAFYPRGNWHMDRCHDRFGEGEIVSAAIEHERDMVAHRKQFAVIRTAWQNLPEDCLKMDYAASADVLRKYLLIKTGYANLESVVCGSKAAAERVGAYVGDLARRAHGYCIVEVEGKVVRCWTPHSQSLAAMGDTTFRKSKSDITAAAAEMLGVSVVDLEAMGRESEGEAA